MSGDESQTNVTAPDATAGTAPDPATTATLPPVTPPADADPAKTFTQAQVDRIAGDTRQQVRAQFADYAELKAQADELEAIKTAQLGELEQAQKLATDAQARADKALATSEQRLISAALTAEAAIAGAAHPTDAFSLADKSSITLDDAGNVVGAKEAVAALVAAGRLVMPGKPAPPNLNGGDNTGERPPATVKLSVEQERMAGNFGITPEEYAARMKKE